MTEWIYGRTVRQRQTGRHASSRPTPPSQYRCADGIYVNTLAFPLLMNPAGIRRLAEWFDTHGLADDLLDDKYADPEVIAANEQHVKDVLREFHRLAALGDRLPRGPEPRLLDGPGARTGGGDGGPALPRARLLRRGRPPRHRPHAHVPGRAGRLRRVAVAHPAPRATSASTTPRSTATSASPRWSWRRCARGACCSCPPWHAPCRRHVGARRARHRGQATSIDGDASQHEGAGDPSLGGDRVAPQPRALRERAPYMMLP